MARRSQRTSARTPSPAHRSRGPVLFGILALVMMLALATWAIRGLLRSSVVPASEPTATAETGAIPIVTPTPRDGTPRPTAPPDGTTPTLPPTLTPSPTPPPPVVVGDFGELPAPNLPQTAFPPGQVQLAYEAAFDLATIPREAPVYRLVPPDWDEARVAELARDLGIEGSVERTGAGSLVVRSTAGQLIVTGFTVQYQAAEPAASPSPTTSETVPTPTAANSLTPSTAAETPSLPPDTVLIDAARSWLERHRLVTTPLGPGVVRERLPALGIAIVTFGPAEPTPVLSAVPGATLAVAFDGTVRQAFVAWPRAMESSPYSLRPPEALWQDVVSGRGTLEIDEETLARASLPLRGTARIAEAELAWVDAGQGTTRYLTPVVRFRGTATFAGLPEPVTVTVTVAAVAAQAAPRG
ncbi:MAG: hypothetical protein RMK01_09920 [Thermomicrobium sp.]|nr:hypothetical protein [Thermomicrobium sp.]